MNGGESTNTISRVNFVFPEEKKEPSIPAQDPRSLLANIVLNKDSVCGICLEIAERPVMCARCGKVFCANCIGPYRRACPFGCEETQFISQENRRVVCSRCDQDMLIDSEFAKHTSCQRCRICLGKCCPKAKVSTSGDR